MKQDRSKDIAWEDKAQGLEIVIENLEQYLEEMDIGELQRWELARIVDRLRSFLLA